MNKYFKNLASDFPASIVVLLVAIPLCLGIALGSNAPLFSGIIAGIAGGIIIGIASGSQLSVSGPAAGLTVIVASAIDRLNGVYEVFFLAVLLAGVIQLVFGFLKGGVIGDYIPNAVIKGMLAAIGIILILKQLPHLVGYDKDYEGDESFIQPDNENTFTELLKAWEWLTPGAVLIGLLSLGILILWERKFFRSKRIFQLIPGPLVVVIVAVLLNQWFKSSKNNLELLQEHLVGLPVASSLKEFFSFFNFPKFSAITDVNVWISAFTIAVVASLETLLGVEAVDKLDPQKRITPTNRELKAQGLGNMVSGLLGGLPLTSVIVRSSANVQAGAKTKMSTILHGTMMLVCVMLIPDILNKIPLSALAAILIFTGYKLAKVSIFKEFYKRGWDQFIPFVVTILAILVTDLLKGIVIGIFVDLFFLIRSNFRSAVFIVNDENRYLIRLRKDVSFLNKPIIKRKLEQVPDDAYLIIDATRADFIDKDIIDEINSFIESAKHRNITIELKSNPTNKMHLLFTA